MKKSGTNKRGLILYDIILALALSAVFVSMMTATSLEAGNIYDKARRKADLMDAYKAHEGDFADLMPYEIRSNSYDIASSTMKVEITARAGWYGNDRIETDLNVSDDQTSFDLTAVRSYPSGVGESAAGTSLCSVDFMPDNATISITPITLPINPLLPLTDLVVRNNIAYISIDSSTASDSDLLIVDIRDPPHPVVLSTLNTGPGLNALALADSYVYAAAASTAFQLHVIKLNGLSSVYLSKKYQLPLPEASTSPPMASSIFYRDRKIYLGTERWNGQEFSVIDVSSPESPAKLGGYEVNSKVNSVYVRGGKAFVANAGQNQIITLDVQNPMTPVAVNAFGPSGWQRQEGKVISYFEDGLSFGRTSGGFNIVNDKELFAFGSSTDSLRFSADVSGGIYGIVQDKNHVFTVTRTLNKEFSVFDVGVSTSTIVSYPLPVQPQTMTCDGGSLYVLAKTAPVIYEIKFIKS